jgi:hypothetical protein
MQGCRAIYAYQTSGVTKANYPACFGIEGRPVIDQCAGGRVHRPRGRDASLVIGCRVTRRPGHSNSGWSPPGVRFTPLLLFQIPATQLPASSKPPETSGRPRKRPHCEHFQSSPSSYDHSTLLARRLPPIGGIYLDGEQENRSNFPRHANKINFCHDFTNPSRVYDLLAHVSSGAVVLLCDSPTLISSLRITFNSFTRPALWNHLSLLSGHR